MSNKLIKDMNDQTWRRFVAYCKMKDIKVSNELDNVLGAHLKKNLKKIFE